MDPPADASSPVPSAPPSPEVSNAPAPVATPVPAAAAPAAPAPAAPAPAAPQSQTSNVVSSVKDNLINVKDKAMDTIQNSVSGDSAAVTSLVVGAAIAFFVAFILYWIITRGTQTFKKKTFLIPDTKTPKTGYEVHQLDTDGIPTLKNNATVSFWLYVNEIPDVPVNNTVIRHVWHRGDSKWGAELSSPLVLIKSSKSAAPSQVQKNTLLISFKSETADNQTFNPTKPSRLTQINYMVASRGLEIDYIPVKRWVHVAVTVDKKSKIMKAYVDGENVKTVDARASKVISNVTGTVTRKLTNMDLNGTGNIHIGGRPTSDLGLGFSGLVSNIRYSNWDMSAREVYREYKRGPIDNLLSRMGLPAYGVQTPVYKIL